MMESVARDLNRIAEDALMTVERIQAARAYKQRRDHAERIVNCMIRDYPYLAAYDRDVLVAAVSYTLRKEDATDDDGPTV